MALSRDISSVLVLLFLTSSRITTLMTFPLPKELHSWTTRFSLVLRSSYRLHNTSFHFSSPASKRRNTSMLHAMCCASKAAWNTWRNGSHPRNGPVYEEMHRRKKDVRSHVRSCRAQEERFRLQERDRLLRDRDFRRFFIPRNITSC